MDLFRPNFLKSEGQYGTMYLVDKCQIRQ